MPSMPPKDPMDYSLLTYAWVILLAAAASAVRYLNTMEKFVLGRLIIEMLSGGLTGLLTFWICEWQDIHGPLTGFLIGVSGLMGSRLWSEFSRIFSARVGVEALNLPTPVQAAVPVVADKEEGKS